MRTVLVALTLLVLTPVLGSLVLLAALFRVKDREGSIFDRAPRWWASAIVRAAGIRIRLHNAERLRTGDPHIFVSNHISWFDVLTLASILPRYKFVGKAELFKIPIFGPAARASGMIAIERENRKAAFESYRVAAERIRDGASVVVFPEGTRGKTYELRPFKKGPFVLAVAAQAPIVPTLVHGTREVMPRDTFRIRGGQVDIHFLDPIEVTDMTYEDRNRLSQAAWDRLAAALRAEYGVESSLTTTPAREGAAVD
jgi:1-acyl-sn-glycerol-3-phosphate acyltransferase